MVIAGACAGLLAYGALRYGVLGPAAVLAGGFDVSVLPVNRAVSSSSIVLGLLLIGWLLAAALWVRARRAATSRSWLTLGAGLAGAVAITAVAIASAYGAVATPATFGAVLLLPLAVTAVVRFRQVRALHAPTT